LNADNITATSAGRPIAWQQPLAMAFDAHETPEGIAVDNLQCESEFLKAHANGTPDAFDASLSLNLKPLSTQLGQFIDLEAVQLAGEGWGSFNWKRSQQRQFETDGELQLRNFQVVLAGQQPWVENNLAMTFTAKGLTKFDEETRIDVGAINVKSGTDQIEFRLTQPVKDLRNGGVWAMHLETQGQLQNWPNRLLTWLGLKDLRMSGGYVLSADGAASASNIAWRQVSLAASPLRVNASWLNLDEPRLDATLSGSWDPVKRSLQIEPANFRCSTAIVEANNIVLAVPKNGPIELDGTLKCQGDVARIHRWLTPTPTTLPSPVQFAGKLNGTVQFRHADGVVQGETTTEIANLTITDATGQPFQEPQVRLVAKANYNNQTGVLQLEQAELTSSVIAAGAGGRISPVSGVNNAEINGQVAYDMERFSVLMRPYLGSGVRMVGRGTSAAWYRGPFTLATSQGAAGLKWDAANIYGFQCGPGELKATMMNGLLQFSPIDVVVSRGQMHLAPSIRLTSKPMELILPQGPLAQQIQIDTVLCGSTLKYVAPAVADVAAAQGSFSIDLDNCRIPLTDPKNSEIAGRLTIHSAQVASSPLIRVMTTTFMNRESPAQVRQGSIITFKMVDGRVYHQGLELIFPEINIRTQGWVGFDQKMSLMAEMPVPPKWLQKNAFATQAMRDQTIRIPIAGSLSRPAIDQKAVETLTRQFVQKAATNVIQGQVDKELDRLFGPKK
jgi:hypothetical protein